MVITNQKPVISTQKSKTKEIKHITKESHHHKGREQEKKKGTEKNY